jgi:hypothetical protein
MKIKELILLSQEVIEMIVVIHPARHRFVPLLNGDGPDVPARDTDCLLHLGIAIHRCPTGNTVKSGANSQARAL